MLSHKFILLAIAALAILVVVYVITRVPRTRTQPTASAPAASLPVSDLFQALETHYPDALAEIGQVAPGAELELYTLASDLLFSLSPRSPPLRTGPSSTCSRLTPILSDSWPAKMPKPASTPITTVRKMWNPIAPRPRS